MSEVKFSVEFGEFKKKINYVRNGLGASKTDLQVTIIRVDVTGSKATLFAASKQLFCRTEMKITRGEDPKDGSFAVLGAKLEKLIAQVEAEQISIAVDAENMEVQAGFLTVNFELLDGSSLKTVENGVQEHLKAEGLVVTRGALEEGFTCAKTCTTTNSIRPDVTHVELRQGRILSSDGRKIMIYSHDGLTKEVNLKCPADTVADVTTALKNIEAENVQVIEGTSYYFIKANLNEYTMGVRKVERTFPAVEGQLTKITDPTDEVAIDKNILEAMLKGVALGLPSEEVKVSINIGGTGKEAYIEVSATNSIGRRSHERASIGRKAEAALTVPVSFKHLLDTLSVFKGDSVVDMVVLNAKNLLVVRDTTEVREVLTVIPHRTEKQIEAEKKEEQEVADARKKAAEKSDTKETAEGAAAVADAVGVDLEDA